MKMMLNDARVSKAVIKEANKSLMILTAFRMLAFESIIIQGKGILKNPQMILSFIF